MTETMMTTTTPTETTMMGKECHLHKTTEMTTTMITMVIAHADAVAMGAGVIVTTQIAQHQDQMETTMTMTTTIKA